MGALTIALGVGDVKQASLSAVQSDGVYMPSTQWHFADQTLWLVVSGRGNTLDFVQPVREAIWSVTGIRRSSASRPWKAG